ncbi:immunity 7 family protein [Luteolibacter arcticus]|uniref:Immunity 7 family protein n=1 Tax=Luteolibacter arcticus TaxID=1581411 RepID=A0ABT3GJ19_9BACT|nr:immunity 7 family protein [Luteolibacter arcticus]MCW1923495.1 immunity 7 family protein [Luteolibacter arcticus]
MMLGFGWCHLQTSRERLRDASLNDVTLIEDEIDRADAAMFAAFREWMAVQGDPFIVWTLLEAQNNHHGLLTYSLSRNHRSSAVWAMLDWIVANAPGSYGLFHCHDDEDTMDRNAYGRNPPMDYNNVFRVHRIKNGKLEELADPFFGLVEGDLGPVHPYNRGDAS